MELFRKAPTIANTPTLGNGDPPPPELQEQVVRNQVRSAAQWDDTARDMAVSDILVESEREREVRWELVAAAALIVLLLVCGIVWTFNNRQHDRMTAAQRSAGQVTPYTPETIR